MKKYLVFFTLFLLSVSLYNPAYWSWLFSLQWKYQNFMKDLYRTPPTRYEVTANGAYTGWKKYDFLEFKITLPSKAVEARSISDDGIELKFDKFAIASINLLAGRSMKADWQTAIGLRNKAKFKVPKTFYESLVHVAKITPDDIHYFSGEKRTNFLIRQLMEKAVLFRNIQYWSVFVLPNAKGIYWEKEDNQNLLYVFSKDENKGFALWIQYNTKERRKRDQLLARIIKSIEFANDLPEKQKVEDKISKIVRQLNPA